MGRASVADPTEPENLLMLSTKEENLANVTAMAKLEKQDPPFSECPQCGVLLTERQHNRKGENEHCENTGRLHGDQRIKDYIMAYRGKR